MLERRRVQPGMNVVTQGDVADFCFIIAQGKCDIAVMIEGVARIVAQLPAGALVGEAGLLSDTGRRNATVRAAGRRGDDAPIEVLVLQKEDFLALDSETLESIKEIAQYNSACTKESNQRSEEDLDLLQQVTADLDYCRHLPPLAHRELCRVMKYRKVAPGAALAEKGSPTKMFIVMSGQAAVFASQTQPTAPRRRSSKITLEVPVPSSLDLQLEDEPEVAACRLSQLPAVSEEPGGSSKRPSGVASQELRHSLAEGGRRRPSALTLGESGKMAKLAYR